MNEDAREACYNSKVKKTKTEEKKNKNINTQYNLKSHYRLNEKPQQAGETNNHVHGTVQK